MKTPFYKYNSVRSMPESAKKSFDRSYAGYEKAFNSIKKPLESKLTKDEYLQEYKGMRFDLSSRDRSLKSIPRIIAKEQSHERSIFQDEAQFKALKESNLKGYDKLTFQGFRKLSTEQVEADLWTLINKDAKEFESLSPEERLESFGTTNKNVFISHYYFGSPI